MGNRQLIVDFLTKMQTQDNRGTASPFFYVIRTKKEHPAPLDNAERTFYWDNEDCCEYASKEEYMGYLKEMDCYSNEEIEELTSRLQEAGASSYWEEKGLFLTEDEAESHLKRNAYHYSSDAHTYVKHAWRAPDLAKFFEALMEEFEIPPRKY